MLRKKKILTAALCAGGVVLSAALTAAETTIVSQPFAKATTDLTQLGGENLGTWAGYGSVTNQTVGYTKPAGVGSPINTATDELYLSVDGSVTCTAATAVNKPATVDMMLQIAKPDEVLALPSGETTGDIQIALGVENNGKLKVYCKNREGNTGWYTIDETPHAEGEWHRVSFTFDYKKQTCQIRLDGEPLMTEYGYLTSDGTGTANGSWYKLNTTTVQKISSLKVVGSTAIDEVVVKYGEGLGEVQPPLADGANTTGGVPNAWLAEQGITREMATENASAPDNSGMTLEAKYLTGLPVGDGKTYAITEMKMTGEGNTLKATLTVPAMTPPEKVGETNVGRQNVIVYGSDPKSLTTKKEIPSGETTVELKVEKADSGVTKGV